MRDAHTPLEPPVAETAVTDGSTPLEPSRSLVFFDRRRRARSLVRAPADFVAQLIACENRVEQFRTARREDPTTGSRHYRRPENPQAIAFERHI